MRRIASRVTETYGLVPRDGWLDAISKACMELSGEVSDGSATTLLDTPPLIRLAGRLTVPETHFMRHGEHFTRICDLAARRLADRTEGRPVRVWSAGCSTGEEPYSVAISLSRSLGRQAMERVEIIGTDLNEVAIEKGRNAVYGSWSFRQTPDWVVQSYFDVVTPHTWRLKDEVRERVRLEHCSIGEYVSTFAEGSLDVILFRNVGIYLTPEMLRRFYEGFRRALAPDGLLLISPVDPRPPAGLFRRIPDADSSIFSPDAPDAPPAADGARERRVADRRAGDRRRGDRRADGPSPAPVEKPAADPQIPDVWAAIVQLADRGQVDAAIEQTSRFVDENPGQAEPYLLRAQIRLCSPDPHDREEAIADLRRAVFLVPSHVLARYWYASALTASGRTRKALGQLSTARSLVEALPEDAVLEDGETPVTKFREAIEFLQEQLT